MTTLKTYAEQAIGARLVGTLEHWRYENGFLCRFYRTGNWKSSLLLANTVGHLAESAWHHPDLDVSFPGLGVKLQTHDAGGITDRDFELAGKIESVIQWQPAKEGGALTGPPTESPAFHHVDYD